MTPGQAMLIALFWSVLCGAIGYGLAVWRCNRAAHRREEARRTEALAAALDALAKVKRSGDGGYEGG